MSLLHRPRGALARAALLLALALPAGARTLPAQEIPEAEVRYDADGPSPDFHRGRRTALARSLAPNAVAVFFAAPERVRSNDTNYEYRQDSDFYYLTGSREPGSALLLVPSGVRVEGRTVREILFVPPRSPSEEVWTGRRLGAARAAAQLGFEMALESDRFEDVLAEALRGGRARVYRLPWAPGIEPGSPLASLTQAFERNTETSLAGSVRAGAGMTDVTTLRGLLDRLREIKTEEEVVLLRKAIDLTVEAHREVMRQVEPGWAEYEIEALIEYTFRKGGAEHPGFNSIVGSGENSVILHYDTNRRRTEPGDVVVIDIGAEYRGYSADVTRTIPVSGRFSPEQREIYALVYEAQQAGIEVARAGATFGDVTRASWAVLADGLARLGLISSPADQAGLRRFTLHGVSHYIGLDVHDAGTNGPMRPGVVFTVEPGLYIPPAADVDPKWWNIGVRIEDDVLVTEGDPVILSAAAPRHPDEVERWMAERR